MLHKTYIILVAGFLSTGILWGQPDNNKASLKPNGIYLSVSFKTKKLRQMLWTSMTGGKRVVCALAVPKSEDLIFIKNWLKKGK